MLMLAGACSDGESFDQEVIVQLFRPKGLQTGKIKVTATQGTVSRSTTVDDPFGDCEKNKVRIVPREEDGNYADLTIRAETTDGQTVDQTTVQVPHTTPVKLVIGEPTSAGLEPSGDCTPQSTNDAGVDDGGVSDRPDAELVLGELGSPCERKQDCRDGECISFFSTAEGARFEFTDGYCTKDCRVDHNSCPDGSSCELSTNPVAVDFGWHCLVTCNASRPCTRQGFQCRGEFCLP